ncbi:MAG: YheC/YheD family protein, partial [Bacillota bacterium]|nr:YheC/YheD family protein [Bacillota bacterium]
MNNQKKNFPSLNPIVGVMISPNKINSFKKQQPYEKLLVLKHASDKTNVIMFYFCIKDVNLKRKKILGTYFNEDHQMWQKKEFPFPNIIYKRGIATGAYKDITLLFKRELKKRKVKPLNYQFRFDKWEVYENLKQYDELTPHLPVTTIYKTPKDLLDMFNITDKIYIKACRGGQGKQVIRAIKLPDGGYEYSYFLNKLHIYRVKSLTKLVKELLAFFRNDKFILQQAIDLINIDQSIVDLRAEVQKNGQGHITFAGIPVRISQRNSPITTHATSYTFNHFFEK